MYLQKLEIQGFKSFAEKTVFEFPKGITVVVGPNGSGKSNVADAIRWVLGEQSLKLLRGKKSEDVIYHGSNKRSRVGMAQVDMFINNEDKKFPVDYSEVVITRRLYRNGDSDYLINKNKVTLGEILMLLAKANFGQKNYAVIGQGMIENVLNANPQHRKDFFDDAAGVKQFQIKRDQALNKLLRSEDNLQQTETLVAEIEPRLKSLKRQVKKLEHREILEKKLEELHIQYYGFQWNQLNEEHTIQDKKHKEFSVMSKQLEEKLKKAAGEIDEIGRSETRSEVYDKLQKQIRELQQKKQDIIKEQTVLQGRMEVEQEKSGQMNLVWLQKKSTELNRDRIEAEEKVSSIQDAIVRFTKQLESKVGQQKQVMKFFQDIEYKLLKAKEKLYQGTNVTLPEVRKELITIYHLQEEFLQKLINTNNLETFQEIKKEAKKLALRFAGLIDALSDDKSEDKTKQEVSKLQKEFEQFLQNKDTLVNEVHSLQVQLETQKAQFEMMKKVYEQRLNEYKKINQDIKQTESLLKTDSKKARIEEYRKVYNSLQKEVDKLDGELKKLQESIHEFNQKEQQKKDVLLRLQHEVRSTQQELNSVNNDLHEASIQLARIETKKEDLGKDMERELSHTVREQAKQWKKHIENIHEMSQKIASYKHQLELIGGIDPETVKEYEDTQQRFEFLTTQSEDLKKAMKDLEQIIDELDKTTKKQFDKSFKKINENFIKYFKILFRGGTANLKLLTEEVLEEENKDQMSPQTEAEAAMASVQDAAAAQKLENVEEAKEHTNIVRNIIKKQKKIISGVEIIAVPPGKKTKNVQILSGGEKALTSLALLSAILNTNPAPFVVLDEVEAALDEANSEKFAAIIKQLSEGTQFIAITHNRVTMHHGDVLYGVTMGEDAASHILSLKLEEAEHLEATQKIKTIV